MEKALHAEGVTIVARGKRSVAPGSRAPNIFRVQRAGGVVHNGVSVQTQNRSARKKAMRDKCDVGGIITLEEDNRLERIIKLVADKI
jgi:hypothetical protein